MAQRLAVVGFIVAAIVAVFAFVQQQNAVQQASLAQTAQAEADDARVTAVALAGAAAGTQVGAEAGQATAVRQAEQAGTAQAEAQASADAAAARADLAGTAQARAAENAEGQMTGVAVTVAAAEAALVTFQAQATSDLATAGAIIRADATEGAALVEALATATAQIDLAQFAASAAEDDRAAALVQSRAAQTAVAALSLDLATAQFHLTGLPPALTVPPSTAAPTATTEIAATPAPETPLTAPALDLPEQFTTDNGFIQFSYPAGWLAADTGQGPIGLVSSGAVSTRTQNALETGQVEVTLLILSGSDVSGQASGTRASDVAEGLIVSISSEGNPFTAATVADTTIGGQSAARVEGDDGDNDLVLLVIDTGSDLFGILLGRTARGERDQFEPTLHAILESLTINTSSN